MNEATAPLKLSHKELFISFFRMGIIGFGGVLPIVRRIIVDERRWLTQAAFTDLFSVCQLLPGANVTNFAFAFGARHRGIPGGITACTALVMAPLIIVLTLGEAYTRYGHLPVARHVLIGLAAAASGLVVSATLRIAAPTFQNNRSIRNVAISALVFALVILLHLSLLVTLAIVLPVSLLLAWRATP